MAAKRWLLSLCLTLCLALCCAHPAAAHPMGNFSVNHYAKITLDEHRISVRYFIDLAEIPTFQELQQANLPTTAPDPRSAEVQKFLALRGVQLRDGLHLSIDGKSLPLHITSSDVIFPPGAGGLPTMKMGFVYEASYPPTLDRAHLAVQYADDNYPGTLDGKRSSPLPATFLRSTIPSTDRSNELSNYPVDLLNSPPQALTASFEAALPVAPNPTPRSVPAATPAKHVSAATTPSFSNRPAAIHHLLPAVSPVLTPAPPLPMKANTQQTPRSRFTELITAQHLSAWFLFTAALIAVGWVVCMPSSPATEKPSLPPISSALAAPRATPCCWG